MSTHKRKKRLRKDRHKKEKVGSTFMCRNVINLKTLGYFRFIAYWMSVTHSPARVAEQGGPTALKGLRVRRNLTDSDE